MRSQPLVACSKFKVDACFVQVGKICMCPRMIANPNEASRGVHAVPQFCMRCDTDGLKSIV
jgi:hypothetical protein